MRCNEMKLNLDMQMRAETFETHRRNMSIEPDDVEISFSSLEISEFTSKRSSSVRVPNPASMRTSRRIVHSDSRAASTRPRPTTAADDRCFSSLRSDNLELSETERSFAASERLSRRCKNTHDTSSHSYSCSPPPSYHGSRGNDVGRNDAYLQMCLSELGATTRRELGFKLNEDRLLGRDWKMLAELFNFSQNEILLIQQKDRNNPTDGVVTVHASRYPNDDVRKLRFLLECMERLDAVKVLEESAARDWKRKLERQRGRSSSAFTSCSTSSFGRHHHCSPSQRTEHKPRVRDISVVPRPLNHHLSTPTGCRCRSYP